ncbi:MAG: hypothetical protein COB16_18915 [Rhodobacteraceae bacterium]|nr:MAG: hypothetical protein COB16_18915 [Paracoccaceae bacterium]
MNRDLGSQFTGSEWMLALKDADVKISMPLSDFTNHLPEMDGKGGWPLSSNVAHSIVRQLTTG